MELKAQQINLEVSINAKKQELRDMLMELHTFSLGRNMDNYPYTRKLINFLNDTIRN
jgi:adenine C2-methylase RlmN of 23S rRNA A2503 and tRNA A37